MKVAAFVLLLAVAGLLVVGAADAKKPKCCEKTATAIAGADACASGRYSAATYTCTDTYADTTGCGAVAGSSSISGSIAH